jgi:hypothetical protein
MAFESEEVIGKIVDSGLLLARVVNFEEVVFF